MSKHHHALRIFLGCMIAALAASASLASAASASPAWNFAGKTLEGSETIAGSATASTLALPGLTTTCDFAYKATISNSGGTAEGKVTGVSITKCSTDGVCTVTAANAEGLPWLVQGKTVSGSNYVVLSGVKSASSTEIRSACWTKPRSCTKAQPGRCSTTPARPSPLARRASKRPEPN